MKCHEYYNIRNEIQDGDVILYRGNSLLSKMIQYFDDAYYNHSGIVKKIGNRLFTIDMWDFGIEFVPLSRRMKKYDEFCIVRSKETFSETTNAINFLFEKIERDTKYDYLLLLRIAIYKKTGIDLVNFGKKSRFICSELCQYFFDKLKIDVYKNINLITPQDFIKYKNISKIDILFDYSPKI